MGNNNESSILSQNESKKIEVSTEEDTIVLEKSTLGSYWKANLRLLVILLVIWFVVSFGFGIFLVEPLNEFRFFGFKLGFWFAQQGSIYVFVALIFVYAWCMKRIERVHKVDDGRHSL